MAPETCPRGNQETVGHVYWDWLQSIGGLRCLSRDLQTTWLPEYDEQGRRDLEQTLAFLAKHIDGLEQGYAAFVKRFGRPPVPEIFQKRKRL